jgi:hypothetical protein
MELQTLKAVVGPDALAIEPVEADPERLELPPNPPEQAKAAATADEEKGDAAEVDEGSSLPFSKARCIALVATVTGASFMNTLSTQSVVIILPAIGRDLDIPASRQQWIVSSYALTFGCFLLIWGRIADIYGKRLIFILGSAFVIPVTAVNPLLPNEITFDLFRGLQGFVSEIPHV